MLVSRSARVLMIHVQKTGGSAAQRALRALPDNDFETVGGLPGARHAQLGVVLDAHPEMRDYFIFGFVRNPWARLLSWYAMVERRAVAAAQDDTAADRLSANEFWHEVATGYPTFEDFILQGLDEIPRVRATQVSYLTTPDRRADFIGRTESLSEDLPRALDLAGLDHSSLHLERRNAAPVPSDQIYRERFTPAMRDKVAEVHAADIAEFGYEF